MDKKIPSESPAIPVGVKAKMESGVRLRYALGTQGLKKKGKD